MRASAKTELEEIKRLLEDEDVHPTEGYPLECEVTHVDMKPILHNPGKVLLVFSGWALCLKVNGRWEFEDTTGG